LQIVSFRNDDLQVKMASQETRSKRQRKTIDYRELAGEDEAPIKSEDVELPTTPPPRKRKKKAAQDDDNYQAEAAPLDEEALSPSRKTKLSHQTPKPQKPPATDPSTWRASTLPKKQRVNALSRAKCD
jgi:hypothetical protein